MPAYRLRYKATDFDLADGEFYVGRSSGCELVLDDALVSRRHAVFRCQGNHIEVEDLGSRNGVLVNATRIEVPTALSHLDRVMIGAQELVVIDEAQTSSNRKTVDTGSIDLSPTTTKSHPEEETHVVTGLGLLLSIAEKALSLERYDEAERILARHLDDLLVRLEGGETPPRRESVETATRLAVRLAEGLEKPSWVDWVFNLHRASGFPPPADAIETLHEVVRKIGYSDPRPLRQCLRALSNAPSLSAVDRFVLNRLAGLEQVISA